MTDDTAVFQAGAQPAHHRRIRKDDRSAHAQQNKTPAYDTPQENGIPPLDPLASMEMENKGGDMRQMFGRTLRKGSALRRRQKILFTSRPCREGLRKPGESWMTR